MRLKNPQATEDDNLLASSSSSTSSSTDLLVSAQSFLLIASSVSAHVCSGSVFILNFYISYFVSYVRLRGSKADINLDDGKLLLLLLSASYGMSGFPLGLAVARTSEVIGLTVGVLLFLLGYVMLFLGVEFEYGFIIAGIILVGISAMLISISVLLRCLKSFRNHEGIVSGALIGVAFGAIAVFHILEKAVVNPTNIRPTVLDQENDLRWFYESDYVLDRCNEFFWILAVCFAVLLSFSMLIYCLIDTSEAPNRAPLLGQSGMCHFLMDLRFVLTLVTFLFGGFAGLGARSSLKTMGGACIHDQHFLSSVGGSGAFAAGVGALCTGIVLDLSLVRTRAPQLLLLSCVLCFTASVMMMFTPREGRVWFLFCYDLILFGFGSSSTTLAVLLLDIFGTAQFAAAFGVTSLSVFLSGLWYTFSLFSGLSWKDFWMANAFFSFVAVIGSVGLILQYHVLRRPRGGAADDLTLTYDDDESEFIIHQGKKYVLQREFVYHHHHHVR